MAQYLSDYEIADLKRTFDSFDLNRDGHISKEELATVMRGMGQSPSEREIEDMIREADQDQNGLIEYPEFLDLMARKMKAKVDEEHLLKEAFSLFDKDGDGRIEKIEFKRAMTELGEPLTDKEFEAMMRLADTNGDGVIDYQEFVKWMMAK